MANTEKDGLETITEKQTEEMIDRMERDELSVQDRKLIAKILRDFLHLISLIQQAGIKIRTIREFIFGPPKKKKEEPKTESDSNSSKKSDRSGNEKGNAELLLTEIPPDTTRRNNREKVDGKQPGNNGRLTPEDYPGATHRHCNHDELKEGDLCPNCKDRKLHKKKKRKKKVFLVGHAPISAEILELEVLCCYGCQREYVASPFGNKPYRKFDVSAKSSLAISRYYMGLPWHRIDVFQRMIGVPVPDSTQWDLVHELFLDVWPVVITLINIAAQSRIIFHDDTTGRILSLIEENKHIEKGDRYGIHSSGFVAIGEHQIVLFFTGRPHAGENLDKLLALRSDSLPRIIQMCDASSSNGPKIHVEKTDTVHCNSHAVRKFKDIQENFPDECSTVLEVMKEVFKNDRYTKEQKMTDEQRMNYHLEHSGPLMNDLKNWMIEQQTKYHNIEHNSSLGYAISYMLRHWNKLTRFLTLPGAPLDNNIVERALKRLIFQRKNSYFYTNEYSAYVGCCLTSLIMTAVEAGANPFEYLNELQKNWKAVADNPEQWLPWNYQENNNFHKRDAA